MTALFQIEAIRLRANSRQERLAKSYPALFDSMAQAVSAGVSFENQIDKLASSGPVDLRPAFQKFRNEIGEGSPLRDALKLFQIHSSNRFSDLFCQIVLIGSEAGQAGQQQNWKLLATRTREELGSTGLVLAKQDWIIGSAKVALLSPWLIAALLMQLPQNKEAFATEIGSAILVLGLALSIFAYFLVNQLGSLSSQPRIFNAPS
jgi:tight adherence protein B